MPFGLKIAVSIFGLLLLARTSMKVIDPNMKEVVYILVVYAFIACLIFMPWIMP